MTSAIFETARFRVQITGKTAWVETKDEGEWKFCNQHALPVSGRCDESHGLKAAVEHFEQTRQGDASLRAALTGLRPVPRKTAVAPAAAKSAIPAPKLAHLPLRRVPASRPVRKAALSYYGFRAPLRPPLNLAMAK